MVRGAWPGVCGGCMGTFHRVVAAAALRLAAACAWANSGLRLLSRDCIGHHLWGALGIRGPGDWDRGACS
jgi:hypothetical protein